MALWAHGLIRWGVVLLLLGGSILAGAASRDAERTAPSLSEPVRLGGTEEKNRLDGLVYLGRLQTWVAEHYGLLYQAEAVESSQLGPHLSELEGRLRGGADWLDANGMQGAASRLRTYLRLSDGRRGGAGRLGPELWSGPLHQAVWQTQHALYDLTKRMASPAPVVLSPTGPPEAREGANGLGGLAAVLAVACLAILLLPPEVRVLKPHGPSLGRNLQPHLAALAGRTAGLAGGGGAAARAGWRTAATVEEVVLGVGAVAAQEREAANLAAEAAGAATALADRLETLIAGWSSARTDGSAHDLAAVAAATLQERHQISLMAAGALEETQAIAGKASEATQLAQSLQDQSDKTLQTLTGLMERAGDIDAVVRAIKAIASQTNMLALNASIEAHRAGIGGQGFRVVAESVRDLSHQADQHAREIELRVQGISEALAAAAHDSWRQRGLSGDLQRALTLLETQAEGAAQRAAQTRETARAGEEAATGLVTAVQQMAAASSVALDPPDFGSLLSQARALTGAAKSFASISGEQLLALSEVRRISEEARSLCRKVADSAISLETGASRVHVEVERLRHLGHH